MPPLKYTKELLDSAILRDGATLIGEYEKLNTKTIVHFECKCGKKANKIWVSENFIAKCMSCTRAHNQSKKEGTKMFDTHPMAQYWSEKNSINPNEITLGSHCFQIFNCDKCNHEFKIQIKQVVAGAWCPFCGSKQLCGNKDCMPCYEKSFASSDKVGFLSPEVDIDPFRIFKSCAMKLPFICPIDGEFKAALCHITNGRWCPKCRHRATSLRLTSNTKKFIEKAKNIHGDKYDYTLVEYIRSDLKVIIICMKHGKFEQIPDAHMQGSGCPICINKTESVVFLWCKNLYETTQSQFSEKWLKSVKKLRFDLIIPDLKILIEVDGPQHFKQIMNWTSPKETMERDIYKMKQAVANGYRIIRIFQPDVAAKGEEWLDTHLKPYLTGEKEFDQVALLQMIHQSIMNIG